MQDKINNGVTEAEKQEWDRRYQQNAHNSKDRRLIEKRNRPQLGRGARQALVRHLNFQNQGIFARAADQAGDNGVAPLPALRFD